MNNFNQQQSPCEWMKFIPTPGEKHLGIAVIRYERRFIFRFKVMPSEHGGYWVISASMKTGTANGKDKYEAAFSLDSEYEKSQMTEFVLSNVERELNSKPAASTSVFNQPAQSYTVPQQTYVSNNGYNNTTPQYESGANSNPADDHIPF